MTQGLFVQDPAETQAYAIDWSGHLAAGETVAESAWAATPNAGVTIASTSMTGTSAKAQVGGLTLGQVYRLLNTVTTSAGRILDDDFTIRAFPL